MGSVWVVEFRVPYEGAELYGVFTSEEKADEAIRIDQLNHPFLSHDKWVKRYIKLDTVLDG